ncbi:MAG: glycosyltransferase family 4 protein [Elusimicrobia bacterium]|nr:glycosyltransferase family 4 protein [Elusimicrobiota bacterium]
MKKILYVVNKIRHYRIPINNYLAEDAKKAGYELILVVPKGKVFNDQKSEIKFRCIETKLNLSSCISLVKKESPSAVMFGLHLKDTVLFPLIYWLKIKRIPCVIWKHGINLQDRDSICKNLFFRHLHNLSDGIILFSPNEKKYIKKKNHDRIFIAPNTLNFDTIPEITAGKKDLRRKYGIQFDKIVLFVGRIQPRKRLDDLIEAFENIDNNIGLVIVGPDIREDQLDKIKGMNNVKYMGAIFEPDAVNEIFKMSDVFSIPGANGLGINQAFYWGLPTVTEDVWHGPEIFYLEEGKNGFMVPRGDISGLREKIEYLLHDDEVYRKFSEEAKRTMEEKGNIRNMSAGFMNCIKWVLEKNGRRGE